MSDMHGTRLRRCQLRQVLCLILYLSPQNSGVALSEGQQVAMPHHRLEAVLQLPGHQCPASHDRRRRGLTAMSLSAAQSLEVMPPIKAKRSGTLSHASSSGSAILRMAIATRNSTSCPSIKKTSQTRNRV